MNKIFVQKIHGTFQRLMGCKSNMIFTLQKGVVREVEVEEEEEYK